MIDWKARAARVADVGLTIDGQEVTARPISAIVMSRIAAAHPEPGVPTDDNNEKVWQDPDYLGRMEKWRRERQILEVAAMLGYVHEVGANGGGAGGSGGGGGGGIDIRTETVHDRIVLWKVGALDVVGDKSGFSFDDIASIRAMVAAGSSRVGEAAKNSSTSSPKGGGQGSTST